MINYENILREHNLKATDKRVSVLSIMEKQGHISIDDLYTKVKEKFPSISLATLYKNITLMMKNKLLSEVKITNLKTHYEINKQDHAHLVCEKCNSIVDLNTTFEKVNNEILQDNSFLIKSTNLTFNGICKNCQNT